MSLPRPSEAELLAFSLGCNVADLPASHIAQHAADRLARVRETERAAAAERNATAAVKASRAWGKLPRTSSDGRAYVAHRGLDAIEFERRDLVRYPTGGVAVALRNEQGRIVNVVTRLLTAA